MKRADTVALVAGLLVGGYVYARKSSDAVALFRARIDDATTTMLPLRNDSGWRRFELSLPAGKHRVTFETQADRPQWRFPGFHAEVRAESGATP